MNATEYMLNKLGQECNEINQRCSKALEFSLDEIEPGQSLTNRQRIEYEVNDFLGVLKMCVDYGLLTMPDDEVALMVKRRKVKKFSRYSQELGCLSETLPE